MSIRTSPALEYRALICATTPCSLERLALRRPSKARTGDAKSITDRHVRKTRIEEQA
jgi:hypothetical protein